MAEGGARVDEVGDFREFVVHRSPALSRIAYLLRAPLQRMAYALAEQGRQPDASE